MKENILQQLDMAWQLFNYHVDSLSDEEAMWTMKPHSLNVHKKDDTWMVDWPETETYDIGPASIAWTLWHIIFWWSSAIDYNFGEGMVTKENVKWPGSVAAAKDKIKSLHEQWIEIINRMQDNMNANEHAKWPFEANSFVDIALWLNGELMKNAAEIGSGRFLYAVACDMNV